MEPNNSSNWNIVFAAVIPFFVAVIGGLVAHWLAIWRDRQNKKKDQRVQYLIEAYRRLSKAANHPKLYEVAEEVQSAVNDIQLFGTKGK